MWLENLMSFVDATLPSTKLVVQPASQADCSVFLGMAFFQGSEQKTPCCMMRLGATQGGRESDLCATFWQTGQFPDMAQHEAGSAVCMDDGYRASFLCGRERL